MQTSTHAEAPGGGGCPCRCSWWPGLWHACSDRYEGDGDYLVSRGRGHEPSTATATASVSSVMNGEP